MEYDYPHYIAHALEINHYFPNLLSCFNFFQNLFWETELRIMVSGDGKYLVLFYTGCLRKKPPKINIENIQKLKKKKFCNQKLKKFNFLIFL